MVWIGFDDNRDFKLEGARSALPIWAEFMKHAHQHREYRGVHAFEPPDGRLGTAAMLTSFVEGTSVAPRIRVLNTIR